MNAIKCFSLGLLMGATVAVHADSSNDLCSKLPGHWQGIFTIKNEKECAALNGCTHLVMADLKYTSGNSFALTLTPAVGNGGTVTITCENGEITSPMNPGNTVTTSCDDNNHCFVVYDDPLLTSEMSK